MNTNKTHGKQAGHFGVDALTFFNFESFRKFVTIRLVTLSNNFQTFACIGMQLEGLSRDMQRTQTKLTLICLFVCLFIRVFFVNGIVSL